ncbi:hypothetical protein [Mesorhizobium sp.]|uniref:hypothetical protein n=1 Tax=Mesorhizobium sp. TaxID=1871066 RepID=UPI000FE97C4B|nr:hypothetical protein [Mesorhizobium sp.]RWN24551.1 MAG: hypothetical protein EOR95_32180 [Mesorhizobium sp.]
MPRRESLISRAEGIMPMRCQNALHRRAVFEPGSTRFGAKRFTHSSMLIWWWWVSGIASCGEQHGD